jgi:hypothetical protein
VSLGGQYDTEGVRYIPRLWGVYINKGRSRIEKGVVRKWTDVPLQPKVPTNHCGATL